MVQLHKELRERGYQGSYEAMRHILEHGFPQEKKWQRIPSVKDDEPRLSLSPREAMWLFLRQPEKPTAREQRPIEHLCQIHEEVALAYQLVQQFALLLRTRTAGQLDAWLASALSSPLKDFHPFAKNIWKDIEAVEAGLILPWSSGQRDQPDYAPQADQETRIWKSQLPDAPEACAAPSLLPQSFSRAACTRFIRFAEEPWDLHSRMKKG